MEIRNNIKVSDISWIKSGRGLISNLYYPDNIDEVVDLYKSLIESGEDLDVIGHTSNILFRDSYNPKHVLSCKNLTNVEIIGNIAICECGVHVRSFSKQMVDKGFEGFEGLVDLPGTVGAAIVGNAGCYSCLLTDNLLEIEFLSEDGKNYRVKKENLHLSHRMSDIKRGILKGIILKAYFILKRGDKEALVKKAQFNHEMRLTTQPGPQKNLGSIFSNVGKMSIKYKIIYYLLKLSYIFTHFRKPQSDIVIKQLYALMGKSKFNAYIDRGRWIWKDEDSYELFDDYVSITQKMFPSAKLEIIQKL